MSDNLKGNILFTVHFIDTEYFIGKVSKELVL